MRRVGGPCMWPLFLWISLFFSFSHLSQINTVSNLSLYCCSRHSIVHTFHTCVPNYGSQSSPSVVLHNRSCLLLSSLLLLSFHLFFRFILAFMHLCSLSSTLGHIPILVPASILGSDTSHMSRLPGLTAVKSTVVTVTPAKATFLPSPSKKLISSLGKISSCTLKSHSTLAIVIVMP